MSTKKLIAIPQLQRAIYKLYSKIKDEFVTNEALDVTVNSINDSVDVALELKSDIDHTHEELINILYDEYIAFDTSEIILDADYVPEDPGTTTPSTTSKLGTARLGKMKLG